MPFRYDNLDTKHGNSLARSSYDDDRSRFDVASIMPVPVKNCSTCNGTGEYVIDGATFVCDCVREQKKK